MGSLTPQGGDALALTHAALLPSSLCDAVGFSLVDGPFRSSIPSLHIPLSNASIAVLRPPPHDSRPGWFATPFLYDSFIHYSMPVYPDARKESTMPDNTTTDTHAKGETPYAIVKLTPSDLEPKDWAFLREWANRLNVSLEILLHRILVAAVIGQLYAEKIPEI
jgi:hypothetical protein